MKFILIAAAAPLLWLAYNGIVYRNPLEFANGPYSAKAIERQNTERRQSWTSRQRQSFSPERYFLKSAEVNVAENEWLQRAWILSLVAGVASAFLAVRDQSVRSPTFRSSCLRSFSC